MLTPYDRTLAARSLAYSGLLIAAVTLIVMGTDEAFSTAAMRAARISAFTPALATLGLSLTMAQARTRGELRALLALGASPWRAMGGGLLIAWLLGSLAVGVLVTPWSDIQALFPHLSGTTPWSIEGAGLADISRGIRVDADGRLTLFPAEPSHGDASHITRAAAVAAVLPLAVVLPPWIVAPLRAVPRCVCLSVVLPAALILFHAVGAGRTSPALLPLIAAPLALQLAQSARKPRARSGS